MTCNSILKSFNSFLANSFSFQAPNPSTYKITLEENNEVKFFIKQKPIETILSNYPWITSNCYNVVKKNNNTIVLLELINKKSEKSDYNKSILFSHGNAADLGKCFPLLIDFCQMYQCNIYCYDYSGYGCSKGKPSELEIYNDMDTILDFLKNNLNVKENIIL